MKQPLDLTSPLPIPAPKLLHAARFVTALFRARRRTGRSNIDRLSNHVLRDVGLERTEVNPMLGDAWLRR